jgi:hypothetical protein
MQLYIVTCTVHPRPLLATDKFDQHMRCVLGRHTPGRLRDEGAWFRPNRMLPPSPDAGGDVALCVFPWEARTLSARVVHRRWKRGNYKALLPNLMRQYVQKVQIGDAQTRRHSPTYLPARFPQSRPSISADSRSGDNERSAGARRDFGVPLRVRRGDGLWKVVNAAMSSGLRLKGCQIMLSRRVYCGLRLSRVLRSRD